jgi:hypothetical protein
MSELFEVNEEEYLQIVNELKQDSVSYAALKTDFSEKDDLEESIERNLLKSKKQVRLNFHLSLD